MSKCNYCSEYQSVIDKYSDEIICTKCRERYTLDINTLPSCRQYGVHYYFADDRYEKCQSCLLLNLSLDVFSCRKCLTRMCIICSNEQHNKKYCVECAEECSLCGSSTDCYDDVSWVCLGCSETMCGDCTKTNGFCINC